MTIIDDLRAEKERQRRLKADATFNVFKCSNPNCLAVWDADPRGHCPACIQPDGGGWSTYPLAVRHLKAMEIMARIPTRAADQAKDD